MHIQLTLAFRYLLGRKLRTTLTTLAVIFGVLVIFSMNLLLPTMLASFSANILAASGQVDATITHRDDTAFTPAILDKVRQVAGVRVAAGSLTRTVNLPAGWFGHGANVGAVSLVGLDPRSAEYIRTYPLSSGRFLRSGDETAAVITASLAEQIQVLKNGVLAPVTVGDKFYLPTTQGTVALTVVGLRPARSMPGNEEILVSLYAAQKLLDLPDRINTVEANYEAADPARRAAIDKALKAQLGKDYDLGALSNGTEVLASIQTAQAAFNLFGFLALFMGGFIIFNTFRTIVAERRHDIGMLRALGASRAAIIGIFVSEGFLQGGLGTLIGMGLGYLLALGMVAAARPLMQQYIHLELGGLVLSPGLVILTVALGVGVTLAAGLLPAIEASRLTPLDALRPAGADSGRRIARPGAIIGAVLILAAAAALLTHSVSLVAAGGLAFLIGLVLIAPTLVRPIASLFGNLVAGLYARQGTGQLAQGNLTRQPSRSAVTASATMIGLAVLVAIGGVISSSSGGFLSALRKSLGSDYLLVPPAIAIWQSDVGASQDLADQLRKVKGVGLVSTMRFAASTANGRAVSLLGIDPAVYPQVAGLNFQTGSAETAFPALAQGRGLIANGVFASALNLKAGDTLVLSTSEGQRSYRVVAIAGDYLNAKVNTAYVSQAALAADFHKTEDIFLQLNLAPGVDRTAVEPRIRKIVGKYPQFQLISGQDYYAQAEQTFQAAFAAFYVLFLVMAVPSLISILNTLAIGVIERTREIGMLRAIGSTRGQVRQMVMAEALLLAATGTAFGLLSGLYLGYVMIFSMSATGYPMPYYFPAGGLLAAVAAGLLFGVIAAIIPARQAAAMQIVKALRYE
jgi:putative ABC transport system permease protein